jgi:pimeloyl-ACP methyl ester carboxylesterase
VSTFEAAKDMDILRSALGEAKLNYLGKSYGTYLGAIYISLFPNNVGKFVLDGAVDPNISLRDQNLNQAVGFEKALDDYLSVNKEFTKREIQKFIENSGNNPIKDKRGRELTRSLLVTAVAASLYDNTLGWQTLKTGLHQAIKMGNPKYLFELADSYNNRDTNGHYYSNENDIGIVVNCLDWSDRPTAKELFDDAPNFSKVSPTFGPYIAYSELACVNWPVPPLQAKLPFKNISSPPFVIVGVTKDPATPYLWAQNLNREFPNSVLLTFDGEGHTGHNRGNSCIDNNVDSFFLRGALPKIGLICGKVGN